MEATKIGPIMLKINMQVYWSYKEVILLWCNQEFKISTWKSQAYFFKFCPCGLEKHLKNIIAPLFLQQQFISILLY